MIKVGVDIGNSKISCVVSDLQKNSLPKILYAKSMVIGQICISNAQNIKI